jgi:hypothetical protein
MGATNEDRATGEALYNKEREVTVPDVLWKTRKHTPLYVTFYYPVFVYQIYGDVAAKHIYGVAL